MVSEFGEDGMGLEYKVWQLPIDQRVILINPQKGTAGSASAIDKMQRQSRLGILHDNADKKPPAPMAPGLLQDVGGFGFWFLLSRLLPLFSGLASVSNQHATLASVNLSRSN